MTTTSAERSADNPILLDDLRSRELAAPDVSLPSREELQAIAREQLRRPVSLAAAPFTLSARKPYEAAGLMDFFQPGRWDSTSDMVYMSSIVTGSTPGMWDGTVGYIQYKAPATGLYLVAVRFSGYQQTMKASGPWGTASAFTAAAGTEATVTAVWNGTANQYLFFSITAARTGNLPGLAFLRAVQIYKIA